MNKSTENHNNKNKNELLASAKCLICDLGNIIGEGENCKRNIQSVAGSTVVLIMYQVLCPSKSEQGEVTHSTCGLESS